MSSRRSSSPGWLLACVAGALGIFTGVAARSAERELLLEAFAPAPDHWRLIRSGEMTPDRRTYVLDGLSGSFRHAALSSVDGLVLLPDPPGARPEVTATGLSRDARFVAGAAGRSSPYRSGDTHAVLWSDTQPELLPDLIDPWGASVARDVSADGRVVVGASRFDLALWYRQHAVRWVDGVIEALPLPPDARSSDAYFVSDDGGVILGRVLTSTETLWVRWRGDAIEVLPPLPPELGAFFPLGMTSDGEVLVGRESSSLTPKPVVSFADGSWRTAPDLPSGLDEPRGFATDLDGTLVTGLGIVGASGDANDLCRTSSLRSCPDVGLGFLWTQETGTRSIKDFLVYGCGHPLEAWTIAQSFVSEDGRYLSFGGNAPGYPYGLYRVPIDACRLEYVVPERPPGAGSVFYGVSRNRTLYHADPDGFVELLATHGDLIHIIDIELGPRRGLYVLAPGLFGRLVRVDVDTGETRIVTERGLVDQGMALAIGSDGTPWVLARDGLGGARLVEIGPAGEQSERAHWPIDAQGLEREPGGTLLALLEGASGFEMHRYDPATGTSVLLSAGDRAAGLAVGPEGGIYAGVDRGSFLAVDPDTGAAHFVPTPEDHDYRLLEMDLEGRLLFWSYTVGYLLAADQDTGETSPGGGSGWIFDPNPGALPVAVMRPVCRDGFDNDGDGRVDFPEDPGCPSASGESEGEPTGCGAGHELAWVFPVVLLAARARRRRAWPSSSGPC